MGSISFVPTGDIYIAIDNNNEIIGIYDKLSQCPEASDNITIHGYVSMKRIRLARDAQERRVNEFNNTTANPINLANLAVWQAKFNTLHGLVNDSNEPPRVEINNGNDSTANAEK